MTDFLRLAAVQARTGLSRSEIYRRLAAGTLPQPILISGSRMRCWVSDDIDTWVANEIAASRGANHIEEHENGTV